MTAQWEAGWRRRSEGGGANQLMRVPPPTVEPAKMNTPAHVAAKQSGSAQRASLQDTFAAPACSLTLDMPAGN